MVDYDILLGLQNLPISGANGDVTSSLSTFFGGLSVDGGFFLEDDSTFYLGMLSGSLPAPSESVAGELRHMFDETTYTSSLYFHNGADYIKLNTNANFNYSFTTDPTDIIFATFPTGSTNERAFTFKYVLTSGNAINAGQGQVVGNGSTLAVVNIFNSSSAFGAPSPTFAANYIGAGIAVSASFTGENYTISGSYSSMV